MYRQSFKDMDGNRVVIGDLVIEKVFGTQVGKVKWVKAITGIGKKGTKVYFEGGGYSAHEYPPLLSHVNKGGK